MDNTEDNVKIPHRLRKIRYESRLHSRIIEEFNRDIDHAIEGKRERNEMARRAYKMYRCHLDIARHQFISRVVDPHWYSAINTRIAREMDSLFGPGPFLSYTPKGKTDIEQAQVYNAAFEYHWAERGAMGPVYDVLLQRALFGTAYAAMYWKRDVKTVMEWVEDIDVELIETVDELGAPTVMEVPVPVRRLQPVEKVVTDSPWFDSIHFLEAYPDWEAETVEEGRYFIHAKLRSKQYCREMAKQSVDEGGWDSAAVERALRDGAGTEHDSAYSVDTIAQWQEEVGLSSNAQKSIQAGDLYEEAYYITSRGTATILNRRFVVAWQSGLPMGRKPILHVKNSRIPGEHFGMSAFEIVEKQLIHLNNMANASGTEAVLSVFTPMLVKSSVPDVSQIKYGPGKILRVNSPDDITPLVRPTTGIEVAEMQQGKSKASIDDALATTEAIRGGAGRAEQSATAIATSVQGAGIRLQLEIKMFEEQFTVPLGRFYRDMMRLMQSDAITVQVNDGVQTSLRTIEPEEFYDADLDVVPVAGSSALKELEVKRLLEFAQMVMNFQVPDVDMRELVKVVGEIIIPKHASRILKSVEQVQQEQQQQQMAMQAEQAAKRGMVGPNGNGAPPVSNRLTEQGDADAAGSEMASEMGSVMSL